MTTQGAGPMQLELFGQMMFGPDRLGTLGPFLIGMWLDALGCGAIIALFARWQMSVAPTDRPLTRLLVYYLMLINLGMTGYILAYQLYLFVSGFGEYKGFLNTDWSRVAFTMNAMSRTPAAAFFVHRAWCLYDKKNIILIGLTPPLIASACCSFAVTATYTYHPTPLLSRRYIWAFCSIEVGYDIVLTALLAWALLRRKTGWYHTDKLITRLLQLLAETQLPPTITAIAFVIVTALAGESTKLAYFQAAPKVHIVCLLIVITSRIDLGHQANSHGGRQSKFNDESIELGSTDNVRVDRVTYVHSAPDDGYHSHQKKSVNRDDLSVETPTHKLDFGYPQPEQRQEPQQRPW